MTTYTLPPVKIKLLPTRQELIEIMHAPIVAVTMIICGTLLALAVLAGVVFLAYTGNDAAVIGTVVGAVITGVVALMNARIRNIQQAVQNPTGVKENGDGNPS